MNDVYANCPVFEGEQYFLRLTEEQDAENLLEVYSDLHALPFFNSDNCNGDNFYYHTPDQMRAAIGFWMRSYEARQFVRFTVIDKACQKAVGTVELFHRESDDAFHGDGVLRLDVRNDYEEEDILYDILSLILPSAFALFACDEIITKAPCYAIERIKAIRRLGFTKSEHCLIGTHDGYAYNGYWVLKRSALK